MRDVLRAVAERHEVTWGVAVETVAFDGAVWSAAGMAGHYDAVTIALPAEQAVSLLAPRRPDFAKIAANTPSEPGWTTMVAFAQRVATGADIVRNAGPVGWAARDSAKPGRGPLETWVIQATPDWSRAHLEEDADTVATALLAAFAAALDTPLPDPLYLKAHRWRYARSGGRNGPGLLWDPPLKLGVCGDWLADPRVEAAWLSGRSLARRIVDGREDARL